MPQTTYDQFAALAAQGNVIPVCRELLADLQTPVSAFLAVAGGANRAFLLESVEGGEHLGRYSFLGRDPFLTLRARGSETVVEEAGSALLDPRPFMTVLHAHLSTLRSVVLPGLPRLTSGAVGFLAYDAATWFEPAVGPVDGDPGTEAAVFMFFDTVLAFDHVKHRIMVIANARMEPGDDLRRAYDGALNRIETVELQLRRPLVAQRSAAAQPTIQWHGDEATFEDGVRRIKDAIRAGDIYQAVLSRRCEASTFVSPFRIYRALRHVNPSPYLSFLRIDETAIVGSSPEMLVRVEGRRVETHPIAGTRPRGRTPEEDTQRADELMRDEKERAEHVMLVDLGRNDLGRICRYGSVAVPRFMEIVRYSHVMHIASTVEGELAAERDCLDALAACFPAGTVSGAPKIRAMQFIRELEPEPRGVYAGAVGYIDFAGNLDCCIAIRTIVIRRGMAHVQAGAGIVYDSDPSAELEETENKARALWRALTLAHAPGPSRPGTTGS